MIPRDESPEQRKRDRRQLKLKKRELNRIWRRLESCKEMKMRPIFNRGPDDREMKRLEQEIAELEARVYRW